MQNIAMHEITKSEIDAILSMSHEQVQALPWFDYETEHPDWAQSVGIDFGFATYGVNAVNGQLRKMFG